MDRRGPGEESDQFAEWVNQLNSEELKVSLSYWQDPAKTSIRALHRAEIDSTSYPNRWGARVPTESNWNLPLLQSLLQDYEDSEVVEWLRYGWPISRLPTLQDPEKTTKNHDSVTQYPEAIGKYIHKGLINQHILGPLDQNPFAGRTGISPLSSVPKRESEKRRVILNLSFPVGRSVNDGIPKDNYLGFCVKLRFPSGDDLAKRMFELGKDCWMFKMDLEGAFRQMPLDLADYGLIGYMWEGKFYFDLVLPMGLRSAQYIYQRVTNAIAYVHRQLQYFILNYVDDFRGAEKKAIIWAAFSTFDRLLKNLGVKVAPEKMVEPT